VARLTRVESQQRTRQRLLEAAERLFAKRGFHATSIEDIVEAAGFTRGAFYGNFADKEDLFLTLLEQRTTEQLSAYEATDETPSAGRSAAVQAWFDATTRSNDALALATAEFWPSAIRNAKHRRRLRARSRAMRAAIVGSVEQFGNDLGITWPLPSDQIAAMLLAIGEGLALQRSLDPEAVPANLLGTAITAFWAGLITAQRTGTPIEDLPKRLV
jgi:AcrR family transcriptional regulator